jgi:hypothetical protein
VSYKLEFPNLPEAEPYEGATEFTAVFDWVYEEAQKVVEDHLADYVDNPQDEDGRLAAAHKLTEEAMDVLWWRSGSSPTRLAVYRFRDDSPLMRLTYTEEER